MARILIVDDHPDARAALREILAWHAFQVCGDAQDGKEAVEKVAEMKPDIVLLDINMPVMNGIAAAMEIRRKAPTTKIVFLSVHDGPGFRAGTKPWADGFVPKSQAGKELIPTLERVAGRAADEVHDDEHTGQCCGPGDDPGNDQRNDRRNVQPNVQRNDEPGAQPIGRSSAL
jgi:DNA-binding NarL/FixJ family response regulator